MASLDELRADVRPWAYALMDAAHRAGWAPKVSSVFRSAEYQKRVYARYKAGLSAYPAAPPGSSQHERGLAFDLHPNLGIARLRVLGAAWRKAGFTWGGEFADPIHFDFRPRFR
jgi:hypothetical protein